MREDIFRSQRSFWKEYVKHKGLLLDAQEASSFHHLFQASLFQESAPPLFLKNASLLSPSQQRELLQWLQQEQRDVFFWEQGESKSFLKKLQKVFPSLKVVRFPLLSSREGNAWIKTLEEEFHTRLTSQERSFLFSLLPDSSRCFQEFQKISLSKDLPPEEKTFLFSSSSKRQTAFLLFDLIAAKKKKEAFLFLQSLLLQGESPHALLGLFAWYLRQRILVLDNRPSPSNAKKGVSPFVAKKILQTRKHLSLVKSLALLRLLAVLDYEVKTGKREAREALEFLLLSSS